MQDVKLTRRVVGMLAAGLRKAGLFQVTDQRHEKGKKWPLISLLNLLVVGLAAGKKSLGEVEEFSGQLSQETRVQLKVFGQVADTTLRDLVVRLLPVEICGLVRRLAQAAYRSKSLVSILPLRIAAMDGKATAIQELNSPYVQTHKKKEGLEAYGLVRTITITLVTALCRPLLEVVPMGAGGNEMGFFRQAFATLVTHHKAAFDVVTYDAGANCASNAKAVVDADKDFVFALKNKNRFLMQRAEQVLGHKPPAAAEDFTEDILSKQDDVRVLRYLFVAQVPDGYKTMKTVRTVLRVYSVTMNYATGEILSEENRYYVSSLLHTRLTFQQWLLLVRLHWGVEVTHNILDKSFQEDDRPFLTHSAQGMLVMLLLRRLAYTLLAQWKGRTLKTDENRSAPWTLVFLWVQRALEQASASDWADLRERKACPAFA